jgi:alkanesulfonate monooxygenase SsuD/methylene tetrahydromethanopterin reductase-like flavin-dependent oxidoreductase (luciferase family)
MSTERNAPTGAERLGLALNLWDRMTTWAETLEIARAAEQAGFGVVVIPESFGRDGFTLSDRLLAATERIHVCFGIANVFSRSPAVLAQTAATLDELSGGRFLLGLGGSTPNLVEGWHGLKFEKPLARVRETIEMARRIWRGDRSPFEGEVFRAGGVKLGFAPVRSQVPVWLAALLPRSLELAGELADGWMPTLSPIEIIGAGRAAIARGAARARRDPLDVTIAPTLNLMVTDDAESVLPMLKFAVAIYYGPQNSPYARAAADLGYADDVAEIVKHYAKGGSRAAAQATSDRLARSMAVAGPLDDCRRQIAAIFRSGADRVVLGIPAATRAACEPIFTALAAA